MDIWREKRRKKSIIDVKCDDKNDRLRGWLMMTIGKNKKSRNHRANRVKWRVKEWSTETTHTARQKIQIIYYNWKIAGNFSIFSPLLLLLYDELRLHAPLTSCSFNSSYNECVLCGFTAKQQWSHEEFRMKIAALADIFYKKLFFFPFSLAPRLLAQNMWAQKKTKSRASGWLPDEPTTTCAVFYGKDKTVI